ncbi:MAG TPA: LPS export ABC transporter permease LptF [Sphingomicrobium sp.]|nr:LPS export ABC transporter permease LptF [Sphingomicrobium sp.]
MLDRYLARNIAIPLIGTLVLAAMLLVLEKMLRLFDFVITAGGPVSVVWRMLANLLPEYFSLGIPIGLLLGILLAFRKLAISSELDAMRGIGVGFGRLLRVPYMFAIGLMLVNIAIVGWVDPIARYRYEGLRFELKSGALGASIKVGEFNRFGKRMTLRIDRSEQKGTRLLGIFTALEDKSGMRIAATATEGQFLSTDDPDTIIFRLKRGRLVQEGPSFSTPRTLSFESYDLPINLPSIDPFRGRGNEMKELVLPELVARAYGGTAADTQDELAARANLHFRLVEVVMMLMLPLLAIALAVPPKRSGSSLGIFVGIVMVVTYHKINQYAESAGAQGRMQPELALWLPFVGLVVLILWMFHVISDRPGGQPIGALEAAFARLGKLIRKLLPRQSFQRVETA